MVGGIIRLVSSHLVKTLEELFITLHLLLLRKRSVTVERVLRFHVEVIFKEGRKGIGRRLAVMSIHWQVTPTADIEIVIVKKFTMVDTKVNFVEGRPQSRRRVDLLVLRQLLLLLLLGLLVKCGELRGP